MKKILHPIDTIYKSVTIAFLFLLFVLQASAQNIAAVYTNTIVTGFNNSNNNTSLSVYPNPASDEAKLVFNESKYGVTYQVRIINNVGIQLTNIEGTSVQGQNIIRIHVGNYPPGIYFVNLLTSVGTETLKLLKQPLNNL